MFSVKFGPQVHVVFAAFFKAVITPKKPGVGESGHTWSIAIRSSEYSATRSRTLANSSRPTCTISVLTPRALCQHRALGLFIPTDNFSVF